MAPKQRTIHATTPAVPAEPSASTGRPEDAERWQKAGATLLSVTGGSLGHPKQYTFVESRSMIERLLTEAR